MKICRMTATFGCLDQAVLEPKPGVNTYILPNESGKSTWAAFLTAMFYGIDTSQRASKGKLPPKTRYQPWNGKPMAGTVELEHQGRFIVLQRTSERGKPFGIFRAWDRETGLDIPELTAENCGRKLLGVEEAVFRRSAFLGGADLSVTQEQNLARRLGALAAAGREQDSYPQAEQALKLWQNRCRYHKTGLIPETEERLRQTGGLLETVEELRTRRTALAAELEQCTRQAESLEQELRQTHSSDTARLREELEAAHRAAEVQAMQAAALPEEETLHRLQLRLEQLQIPESRPEEVCPPALEGIPAEMIWPKAQRDQMEVERLTAGKHSNEGVLLGLAALLVMLAVVLLVFEYWLPGLGAGLMAGLPAYGWYWRRRHNRKVEADLKQAMGILESYGVTVREALLTAAMTRRDWLLAQEQAQRQEWELAVLLEEVRNFSPMVETAEEGAAAVNRALQTRKQAAEAARTLEQVQLQWRSAPREPVYPEVEQLRRRAIGLRAETESLLRQEAALGGWETLQARVQKLETQLETLQQREQALIWAREALAAANSQLTQVYSPQLTRLAGMYLNRLTQSRYDGLVLDGELNLSVRETATGLVRSLAALSRGTQDQTWLALRLAMTRLLLPEHVPIVLDDALLTFDPVREAAAMEVLREENRQVLLFACR